MRNNKGRRAQCARAETPEGVSLASSGLLPEHRSSVSRMYRDIRYTTLPLDERRIACVGSWAGAGVGSVLRRALGLDQLLAQLEEARLGQRLGEDVGQHLVRRQVLEQHLSAVHQVLDEVVSDVDVLGAGVVLA